MNVQVIISLTTLSMAIALPHGYGPPNGYRPMYKQDSKPYYFDYQVHDDYQKSHYTHNEKSDGKNVYGSYTVALPDGRKQTVEYTADHHKGFVAKVSYTGKANHPKNYGPTVSYGAPQSLPSYHQPIYGHQDHYGY